MLAKKKEEEKKNEGKVLVNQENVSSTDNALEDKEAKPE